MKTHTALLVLIFIGLLGCKKQNLPSKPQQSAIFSAKLEQSTTTFPAGRTTASIDIVAGNNGWSLTQNTTNSWLVADKNFGAGDYKLRVTLNANTTGNQRTSTIRLVSTNTSLAPVLITFIQDK